MLTPLHQPLRFTPYFRPMPWGGRALARYLGKNLPADTPIGESWEVSDHPSHASALATGPWYGTTLRQLMERHRPELLGPAADRHERFPWLVKLLDAHETLSVQVHPDANAVKTLWPGEGSKSECWLVLDAQPGSLIYAGLKPGIGPDELRRALQEGGAVECLHGFEPKVGDFISLPAGTVHALGGGLLVAEVQETSDATFRLYDWERRDAQGKPRQLHLDKGLASIDWQRGPVQPTSAQRDGDGRQQLLASPHFHVEAFAQAAPFDVGGAGGLQTLIVTAGQGRLGNGDFFTAGDVWVLPACLPATTFHVETPTRGLLCTLP